MDFEKTGFATRGEKRSLLLKDEGSIKIRNPGLQTELSIITQGNITLFTSEKVDSYRREVEYMDHHIGVLTAELKELGLLDRSIIMLVGDHGEGLGEYKNPLGEDYFGHIHYLHGVYMKVPLLIFDPFSKKKVQESKEIVSLQDIAPTVIDMMGWKKIPFHSGRNLFKLKASEHDILFTETYTPEAIHDRFAGLQYPWHLIFTPAKKNFELYNLEIDPQEKVDVFTENKDDRAVVDLTKHVYDTAMEILKTKRDIPLDDKSLEMLKALGYIK
jgi:arylsulfatase A-like enzyme